MAVLFVPIWKEAPFLRIVLPFITGIITERYCNIPPSLYVTVVFSSLVLLALFSFTKLSVQFKLNWLHGILLNLLLICFGGLLTSINKPKEVTAPYIVSIKAPLSEKPKTWKAKASYGIVIYFRKDPGLIKPSYGDRLAFLKSPEDNRVFLKHNEFIFLQGKEINPFQSFLFDLQDWVVATLRKYIPGKKECGLAEALLIGYKDDLDKELMKAYSNTGVVHVVAISGLHLGLIYVLLKYVCYPFSRKRFGRWLTPVIIISGLWIFSLLAGGSPSVMRSAVMFTFIVAGESFARKTSIYNNLAASAFFLLCYDPDWLWDIGFQLSYSALLSIVVFMKPIYNQLIIKNKVLDAIWKLNAVTLAAQVLTTPICVFYFNQFPNLFLITNFIAVPVSSIILMGEIALCAVAPIPVVANVLGQGLSFAIKFMNGSVEWLGSFSFSTTVDLHINLLQLVIAYLIILIIGYWMKVP
jgi:competence protein ComEC